MAIEQVLKKVTNSLIIHAGGESFASLVQIQIFEKLKENYTSNCLYLFNLVTTRDLPTSGRNLKSSDL